MKKLCLFLFLVLGSVCEAAEYALSPGEAHVWEGVVPRAKGGERVILSFLARLKGPMKIGAQYTMKLEVDGKNLGETLLDIPRIVNRRGTTFHGTPYAYFSKGLWNVVSNPEEEYIEIVYVPEDYEQIYFYELDVSDLTPGKHKFVWTNADPDKRVILIKNPSLSLRQTSETAYAALRDFTPFSAIQTPLEVDADNGKAEWKFTLPPLEGKHSVLRVRVRINCGAGWGNSQDLRMKLNGKTLTSVMSNGRPRMFNRKSDFLPGTKCCGLNTEGLYGVNHHGNADQPPSAGRFASFEGKQSFWGYLDISDCVKPSGENVLTFENLAQSKNFKLPPAFPKLIVEHCEAGYCGNSAMNTLPTNAKRSFTPGETVKKKNYELTLAGKKLGLQILCGKHRYYIDSFISYPYGGMNSLFCAGAPVLKAEKEWSPEVKRDGDAFTITAHGKYYNFTRNILCEESAIRVRDTIASLSGDVLGVVYGNTLVSVSNPKLIYKHGATRPVTPWEGNHANPAANSTMFIQMEKGGLGIFIEDDLFKLQCDYSVDGNMLDFRTRHLGFAPKASHTLEWSIHPLASGEYFDYINILRNELGINSMTIPGTLFWPDYYKRDETKKQYMINLGTEFPAIMWFDLLGAPKQERPASKIMEPSLKDAASYRKLNPDSRPVLMWQTCYTRCNSRKMPLWFSDSCMVGKNGKIHDNGRLYGAPEGEYYVTRYFTEDNSYFKYARDVIQVALDNGFEGIYFDTPNHTINYYGRFTYDRWDFCTVDLDLDKYTVVRKYADLCLISGPARTRIAKMITDRGKYIYYNNPPILKSMHGINGSVFMTEGDNDIHLARVHLTTPLAFGEHYNDRRRTQPSYGRRKTWVTAEDFMDDIRWKLKNGVLYNVYRAPLGKNDEKTISSAMDKSIILDHQYPTAFMYPITPTDLHAGWIRGKERIITILSGKFGWDNAGKVDAELRLFDRAGKNTETKNLSSSDGMFQLNVPENGMAILIRK